jgi:DNA-binding MarR family transcriptional regulator
MDLLGGFFLGSALRATSGVAGKLADRIERNGWIRREADPGDRRVSRLALTDAGRTRLAAAGRTSIDDLAGAHARCSTTTSSTCGPGGRSPP